MESVKQYHSGNVSSVMDPLSHRISIEHEPMFDRVTQVGNVLNQQTQFASATLTYDNNGDLANDGTNTYMWDARDRLVGISGGTSATFNYDALDRRIAKAINGSTSTFLYDGADIVTESGTANASYLSTLNIDDPIGRQSASGNEYYLANDLGSIIALTNDAGAVTTSYTYSPFGTTTVTGSSTNPFQFTGRENDSNGLYYYRARHYSPPHSRFLSEDPLEFDGGDANLYAYVFNNPTNFIDPTGERIKLPDPIKRCLLGMLAAAGIDLAKRKPATDPDTLVDAAGGCGGGGNKSKAGKASQSGSKGSTSSSASNREEGFTKETITRKSPGTDGATSRHIIEKQGGDTTSVTHQVERDKEIVHQHQRHIGKHGNERQFPDSWVEYPTIGEP